MMPGALLNLGCGSRFHPDWVNMDVAPADPRVLRVNLSRGIPLPDGHCAAVYHAAVLEHFRPVDALGLLVECRRVLGPGGILRVGVPDLEHLCRLYLDKLGAALGGDADAACDYDWVMLELFDQMVRERSGGAMADWLRRDPLANPGFVFERIGEEGRALVAQRGEAGKAPRGLLSDVARLVTRALHAIKRRLLALLLGEGGLQALDIGQFRLGGEVHQWMYDRFSLASLLREAGFVDPVPQDAATSAIPNWQAYHLDTCQDGTVIKPDLFFMEARTEGA